MRQSQCERGRRSRSAIVLMALFGLSLASGCSEEDPSNSASPAGTAASTSKAASPAPAPKQAEPSPPQAQAELIKIGRSTYNANCIACHAMDPAIDGALGPAVAGSSLELLEARVLRGGYPAGYVPKRPSRVMIPLPHLEPKLPALAAYLQSL